MTLSIRNNEISSCPAIFKMSEVKSSTGYSGNTLDNCHPSCFPSHCPSPLLFSLQSYKPIMLLHGNRSFVHAEKGLMFRYSPLSRHLRVSIDSNPDVCGTVSIGLSPPAVIRVEASYLPPPPAIVKRSLLSKRYTILFASLCLPRQMDVASKQSPIHSWSDDGQLLFVIVISSNAELYPPTHIDALHNITCSSGRFSPGVFRCALALQWRKWSRYAVL